MRQVLVLVCLALVASIMWLNHEPSPLKLELGSDKSLSELEKLAPNRWLEWKWSFPDERWDPNEVDAAERACGATRRQLQGLGRCVDATWAIEFEWKIESDS